MRTRYISYSFGLISYRGDLKCEAPKKPRREPQRFDPRDME